MAGEGRGIVRAWVSRGLALGVALLLVAVPGQSPRAEEAYIRIDDYVARHPEQRDVMTAFSATVRAPAVPLADPPSRPVRVALIYPSLQASDYWRRSLASFEQRLQRLEIPYALKVFSSRPSVDAGLQAQQLAEALEWQPDYLVFTLNVGPHSRMIERLLAQSPAKLILQNVTTPLANWAGQRPFLYVGFDHAQGTRMMAKWMLERIDHRGKYLMLYYSPGYVSQMRGDTFAAEAAAHPGVEQVAAYYTDGDPDRAYRATLRTLQAHPDLEMIFASATDVALGALRALREADRQDVLLNGWGGGDAELEALSPRGLDVTVMRINDDNGIAMAEAIKLDLRQRPERVPHIFAGDIELIHPRLPPAEIARLKAQAFRLSDLPLEAD